jgi:hypothetical protein
MAISKKGRERAPEVEDEGAGDVTDAPEELENRWGQDSGRSRMILSRSCAVALMKVIQVTVRNRSLS